MVRSVAIVVPLTHWSSRVLRCPLLRITDAVAYVQAPDGSTVAYERESGRASVVRGGAGGGAYRGSSCLAGTRLHARSLDALWADNPYECAGSTLNQWSRVSE